MRKKTVNLLVGFFIGIVIAIISVIGVYYYFGVVKIQEISRQYQMLIDEIQKPETVRAYRVLKDIKVDNSIRLNKLVEVELPLELDSNSLVHDTKDLKNLIANVDIKEGSLLYKEMCYSQTELPNDLRVFEFQGMMLPIQLKAGDYVDVRISFSSGLDFSVLSKKRIVDILKVGEEDNFKEYSVFHLDTDEILRLKSAIVDAYINDGTYLYSTIYVAPDKQKPVEITYPANEYVQELIKNDSEIVNEAMNNLELRNREILSKSLKNMPDNVDWNKTTKTREKINEDSQINEEKKGVDSDE